MKAVAATLLMLISSLALAGGSYAVVEADKDFKSLLTRWASMEGKSLVWEAGGNASIQDPDAINYAAKLLHVTNFADALKRLNNVLDETTERSITAGTRNPPPMLKACIWDDKIVIRAWQQAECGKPLD